MMVVEALVVLSAHEKIQPVRKSPPTSSRLGFQADVQSLSSAGFLAQGFCKFNSGTCRVGIVLVRSLMQSILQDLALHFHTGDR